MLICNEIYNRLLLICLKPNKGILSNRPDGHCQKRIESREILPQAFHRRRVDSGTKPPVENASYFASILRRQAILGKRLEAGAILYESELHPTRRAVALLGNDEFSFALQVRIVLLIDLFAEYEGNHVGVLLNRSRFPQVGQLWTVIAATALRGATQLRQRDDRNCELLRQGLQAPGNG